VYKDLYTQAIEFKVNNSYSILHSRSYHGGKEKTLLSYSVICRGADDAANADSAWMRIGISRNACTCKVRLWFSWVF